MNPCRFGGQEISLPGANSLVVECPKCGVIRTVKVKKDTNNGSYYIPYPIHNELEGTARNRSHWERKDGQWTFIEVQKTEPTNIKQSFTLNITVPQEFDGITLELALSQVARDSHAYRVLAIIYKHYVEAIGEPQWANKYPTQA